MEKYLILVAGGRGTRMKSDQPKQFLKIGDYPILYYSMKVFHEYDKSIKIILVLPSDMIHVWEDFVNASSINVPHEVVEGGSTRMESCQNGLSLTGNEGLVAIHDAVRPLVDHATIDRCFKMAEEKGNAIPVGEIYETIRQVNSSGSVTVDRSKLLSVQTPQVFLCSVLRDAFLKTKGKSYTDEASMIEDLGYTINLVEGNRENIKITDPYDLKIAGFLLAKK